MSNAERHGSLKTRVLVVDDSPLALHVVTTALSEAGFEVRAEMDPFEAVAAIPSFAPDVVVTDLWMPKLSGLEVLAAVKRSRASAPVLLFTDCSELQTAVEAIQRGAFGYIIKD